MREKRGEWLVGRKWRGEGGDRRVKRGNIRQEFLFKVHGFDRCFPYYIF